MFEVLKSDTLDHAMRDNPNQLEAYVDQYVALAKTPHSTHIPTGSFAQIQDVVSECTDNPNKWRSAVEMLPKTIRSFCVIMNEQIAPAEGTELCMYQVSTLQALAMGYNKTVITVEKLLRHGDTGLGTFEGVDGEMIVVDGVCFRATVDGSVSEAPPELGVPFCAVSRLRGVRSFPLESVPNIDELKTILTLRIEEDFGLNSMHMVRIDGAFDRICARSETGQLTQHITLKEMLDGNQRDFFFEDVEGSLVCVYYPDYMDGINAPGWHLHFLSADRRRGGHVFDCKLRKATARLDKISRIEIQLPDSPAFDTYALKDASQDEIRQVEQGKKI